MALFTNDFDAGTDGANLTVATSGGANGDPFSYLIINNASVSSGSSAIRYEADAAVTGGMGCRITPAGTSGTYLRRDITGGARTVIGAWIRVPEIPTTSPIGNCQVLGFRGSSFMAAVMLTTGGEMRVENAANIQQVASAFAYSPGVPYYVQLAVSYGTSTSNGRLEMRVWDLAGNLLKDWDSGATTNTGTAAVSQLRWSTPNSTSGIDYVDFDATRANDNLASGWLAVPMVAPCIRLTGIRMLGSITQLHRGDNRGSAMYLGGSEVKLLYKGSVKVYEQLNDA